MTVRARLFTVAAALAGLLVILGGWMWPELADPDVSPAAGETAGPDQIRRGEYLVRAGNCIACHTVPGGALLAGGRRIPTPFGAVFSTNLTPDAATGIGDWSEADFWRAMHYGRSKDGRRLYPAFPYTNYTLVDRQDSSAIFAFLRSLEPVHRKPVAPTIRFPYNTELALIVWRRLFFRPGTYEPDRTRSHEWNRGAYLVEGLGHCDACHSPRGLLGNARADANYKGGTIPMLGWEAPPLTSYARADDVEAAQLKRLLSSGISERDVTTGPMAEVVFHSLQHLTVDDVGAMVTYLRTLPADESRSNAAATPRSRDDRAFTEGAQVYEEHCSECHGRGGDGKAYTYPALAGNPLVTSRSPNNLLRTILAGGFPPSTALNPQPHGMPPYAHQLDARQIAAVSTYIRSAWGNGAPAVSAAEVRAR